jgi:hypothetical protein
MKKLFTLLVLVMALAVTYGQGFENFNNFPAEGNTYQDGTFQGQDGSTWTYVQCRGDYEITGKAIMIGRNRTPQSNFYSGTISGGIGVLNFDYQQAFSSNVNLNVLVNDVVVGNVTSSGEQGVTKNSGDIAVNIAGDFTIKFINANNSDGQVVVDNVSWTEVSSNMVSTPVFSVPGGTYFEAFNLEITCATPDATIYYTDDGSTPDENSMEYTGPISVDATVTIQAIAYAPDLDPSSVATVNYVFPASVATIAELRSSPQGAIYTLSGEAWLTYQQEFRNQKYIQDASAAILIDDAPGGNFDPGIITTQYAIGDGITGITGTLSEFGGMLQFVPELDPGAATSSGNFPEPEVVTISELFANFDDYEAELVRINAVAFADGGAVFENGTAYTISDDSKATGDFRTTFFDVDYIGEAIPEGAVDIIGLPNSRTDGEFFTSRNLMDFIFGDMTATPTFDPAGGPYENPVEVTIACETPDAMIYYTTDGSNPDENSSLYEDVITIAQTTTLKAKAFSDGLLPSFTATAEYTFVVGEPSEYPADFAMATTSQTATLTWSDAGGEIPAEGYLILISEQDFFQAPQDGTPQEDDTNLSDGVGAKNVGTGEQEYTFSGLNLGVTYYARIYPYTNTGNDIDYKTDGDTPAASGTTSGELTQLLFTTFDQSWEDWTRESVAGNEVWDRDNNFGIDNTPCATMSGFAGGSSNVNEDWLISPALDLSNSIAESLNFFSAKGYSGDPLQLLVSTDYSGSGDPNAATWNNHTDDATWASGEPFWEWTPSGTIDLMDYTDATVYIAFKYTSTANESVTWEIDNVMVQGESTSVNEIISNNAISVYPNPGNGIFTIQAQKPVNKVEVFNVTGAIVHQQIFDGTSGEVNLTHLEKGIYFVKMADAQTNTFVNQKIIIQ